MKYKLIDVMDHPLGVHTTIVTYVQINVGQINRTNYTLVIHQIKDYINFIEQEVECAVKIVSIGPQRHQTIIR